MIHDDQVSRFLRLQAKRRVEDEYWAYDSSSISSYSETLNQVQWVRLSLKFIRKNPDDVYDDIRMFTNYDEGINTYGYTVTAEWDYTQERPYKDDIIEDKRRIYIHYYYSIEKGADDKQAFDKRISSLCNELLEGRQVYYKEDEIDERCCRESIWQHQGKT